MAREMTPDETRSFLLAGTCTGKLAIVRADRADEFGARNAVPGELLVRITPTHIVARVDIAD